MVVSVRSLCAAAVPRRGAPSLDTDTALVTTAPSLGRLGVASLQGALIFITIVSIVLLMIQSPCCEGKNAVFTCIVARATACVPDHELLP